VRQLRIYDMGPQLGDALPLSCGGRVEIDHEIQSAVTTRWATTEARMEELATRALDDVLTPEERAEHELLRRIADLRDDWEHVRNVDRAIRGRATRDLLTA
jgi:hypothetical protein